MCVWRLLPRYYWLNLLSAFLPQTNNKKAVRRIEWTQFIHSRAHSVWAIPFQSSDFIESISQFWTLLIHQSIDAYFCLTENVSNSSMISSNSTMEIQLWSNGRLDENVMDKLSVRTARHRQRYQKMQFIAWCEIVITNSDRSSSHTENLTSICQLIYWFPFYGVYMYGWLCVRARFSFPLHPQLFNFMPFDITRCAVPISRNLFILYLCIMCILFLYCQ